MAVFNFFSPVFEVVEEMHVITKENDSLPSRRKEGRKVIRCVYQDTLCNQHSILASMIHGWLAGFCHYFKS